VEASIVCSGLIVWQCQEVTDAVAVSLCDRYCGIVFNSVAVSVGDQLCSSACW
jgi:uncharacterized membrane protein